MFKAGHLASFTYGTLAIVRSTCFGNIVFWRRWFRMPKCDFSVSLVAVLQVASFKNKNTSNGRQPRPKRNDYGAAAFAA